MKKRLKLIGLILVILLSMGAGIVFYLFHLPSRNIQASNVDYQLQASELVKEYLENSAKANEKYLATDGDSKILSVTGIVKSVEKDLNDQFVVLLKGSQDKAGVSCTFTSTSNQNASKLRSGEVIKIKGVIRSGANYDQDLELYEDVIMEKCDVLK